MKALIVATVRIEGTHHWPACPLEDVSFLRHPHRHVFTVRIEEEVAHDDRAQEFIVLGRAVERFLEERYGRPAKFGARSCETLAREVMEWRPSARAVEVWEDGENGGRVER